MVALAEKIANNFLKIFFVILIFTIPLGEVVRVQLSNNIAISATDILVCVIVLFWILSRIFNKTKSPRYKLKKPLIIFLSIAVLSLIVNFSGLGVLKFLISSLYLIRWFFYAVVYFIVLDFDNVFKKRIPSFLVFSGFILILEGYAQYFFYPNLRNLYYLGWDEHLYRMFSSFLDPNFFGAFLVLYLLFVLGILFKSIKNKNKVASIALSILSFITLSAIFLTYSRGAYVMLIVGVFVFLSVKKQIKMAIGLFMVTIFAIIFFSGVGLKSEGTNLLRTTSTEARIPSALNAISIFRNNPIFGVGFNAYGFAAEKYGYIKASNYPNHAAAGTDNSFLFILATTGILGLFSYLFLWFKIFLSARDDIGKKNIFAYVLLVSSIALFLDSLFINSLFYVFIMLWMWILAGLSEA